MYIQHATTTRRPDFRSRCVGSVSGPVNVTANGDIICNTFDVDGYQSFPSGHSSSAAVLSLFTSMYLFWILFVRSARTPLRSHGVSHAS